MWFDLFIKLPARQWKGVILKILSYSFKWVLNRNLRDSAGLFWRCSVSGAKQRRKGLASSSHHLKPLCVPFAYVILFSSHPPPTPSGERRGLYTEPMKDVLYKWSSSQPTLLLLLLSTLNQAKLSSLCFLSWKLVCLACDVVMKRPAGVKRVKLIAFKYHNLLIPLTQCTSFTCAVIVTFNKQPARGKKKQRY